MQRDQHWLLPLTGVIFAAILVVAIIILGEGQDATEKSAEEIAAYYQDNEDEQTIGSFLIGLAAVVFLFFAGWLRKVLREAEGPGGTLSAVAFAGAIVFAIGGATAATINLALADLADDIDPVALQAINAISWDYFIPFAVGMSAFLLATGISVLRHGALPKWLGWIAVVLGVAAYTPAGFFALIGGLLWILVVSVMLTVRARSAPGAPGAPGTPVT
jgi:hypothetical protein